MSTKRERGLQGGLEIDKLDYERKRLQSARSDTERREVKRRIAESILLEAHGRRCSWQEFNRALQRIQRLGYTNAGKRVEVAALLALSTGRFPEQARKARAMLDEAERRLSFVKKDLPPNRAEREPRSADARGHRQAGARKLPPGLVP